MATTYASDFTSDLLKDPVAPEKLKAKSKEQFFYDIYKPSIGGDAGVLSFFEDISGAGSPSVPNYDQFIAGSGRWRHRSGTTYELKVAKDTKKPFDEAYKNYQEEVDSKNTETQKAYEIELGYTKTAKKLADLSNVSKVNLDPVNEAVKNLTAARNYGASDLGTKLNFQVSDNQIIQDLNASKIARLNNIVETGNAQIVGINGRIDEAKKFIGNLKADDLRRAVAEKAIAAMTSDLNSVNTAIQSANQQIKNYKPITASAPEAAKEITSFRSFLQLPEERASQQLRQIDPESYKTSVALGQQYRQLATAPIGKTQSAQTEAFRAELEKGYRDYSKSPIGATTTAETEALRRRIEDEAMSQLSLGAQLGAEEQRQYQQAARAAQTARGNIFGVAPAVEEAVTTGRAGEERKLARYGAASQFLSSGQTTGDALARDVQLRNALQQSKLGAGGQFLTSGQTMSDALRGDIAFRDALQQNRMGAAANFVAGGPSVYNLAQARTAGQQNAFQNYIQANQSLPGGFNQQPSTAANFYQTTSPEIPVALTNAFNNLYSSLAGYQANTYGAQVGAISRQPSGAEQFGQVATGLGNLIKI